MTTYTGYNMNTMKMIIAAMECLPADYALRNESIKAVGMEADKLVFIQFAAMSMNLVAIPVLEMEGWQITGDSNIWLTPATKEAHEAAKAYINSSIE